MSIIAVPEQTRVYITAAGQPDRTSVNTMYRPYCTQCRVALDCASSHPESALGQGDRHAERTQCHTVGQLALFPAVAA